MVVLRALSARTASSRPWPLALLQAVFLEGEKGVSLQRYEGLGEMNPEQLGRRRWTPVREPCFRSEIEDVAEAEDLFTKLMGDVVEPRREFISRTRSTSRIGHLTGIQQPTVAHQRRVASCRPHLNGISPSRCLPEDGR